MLTGPGEDRKRGALAHDKQLHTQLLCFCVATEFSVNKEYIYRSFKDAFSTHTPNSRGVRDSRLANNITVLYCNKFSICSY